MKKSKGFKITLGAIIGLILIVGLIIGVYLIPDTATQGAVTSSTFVNPDWARLECSPTDAYESSVNKWLNKQTLFNCGGFTEECRFKIIDDPIQGCTVYPPSGRYKICDLNGVNCGSWINYQVCGGNPTDWIFITQGKSVLFDTGIWVTDEDKTKITFEYRPWKLYRFVGGSKWIVNSANCDITSSLKAGIRSEDYPGSKLYRIGGEGQKWLNYVNAWNYGPATNVFTYQSREIYCNSAKLYEIVKLQMADGTLKKLNPSYQDQTESGDIVSGMGSFIKNVECCPNEPNCNDNFEYEEEPGECFTDAQCLNAGGPIPISSTQYIYYRCENENCVEKGPFTTECTNTAECVAKYGTGYVCDLSTTNYGKCLEQIPGGYCGDDICDSLLGENKVTCPDDCGRENETYCSSCLSWGWDRMFKDETEQCTEATVWELAPEAKWYNPAGWLGIEIKQNTWCPVYLIGLGSIILIVLTIVLVVIFVGVKISKRGGKK